MKDYLNIKLGIGLGELRFGSSLSDVRKYLGEPDEEIGDNDIRAWYFRNIGLNTYFDSEQQYKLTGLETYNRNSLLWGKRIFKMQPENILRLFSEMGETPSEKMSYDYGVVLISFDDKGCNLYFEDDALDSVQWHPLFDNSGDNYIWPTSSK